MWDENYYFNSILRDEEIRIEEPDPEFDPDDDMPDEPYERWKDRELEKEKE